MTEAGMSKNWTDRKSTHEASTAGGEYKDRIDGQVSPQMQWIIGHVL